MRARNEGSVAKVTRHKRDGTPYVRYQASCSLGTSGSGKRNRLKGPLRVTRPEAAADLRTMQAQLARGVTPDQERLSDYLTTWLEHLRVKHRTRTTYRTDITRHISPAIGHLRLCDITPAHVNAMIREALKASPSAARKARAVLHAALEDAWKEERIVRNPVSLTDAPAAPRGSAATWTPPQAQAFVNAAKRHPKGVVFLVAIGLGLRIGEALGLLWEDLEDGVLGIDRQLRTVGKPVFDSLKTKPSKRRLRVGEDLLALLEDHRQRLIEDGRYHAGDYPSAMENGPLMVTGHLMFPNDQGGMTRLDGLRKPYAAMLATSGVPRIRIHDLRHFHISSLIHMGADVATASRKAGHSRISTTLDMYAAAFEDRLDGFVVSLAEVARAEVEPIVREPQGGSGNIEANTPSGKGLKA